MCDQGLEVQVQAALDGKTNDAQRSPAQAERVPVAGRLLADRENTGKCVESVRHRQHAPFVRLRKRVPGESRLVVFTDRRCDDIRFAIGDRVIAAHRALQVRKLADHTGQQVAFAEPGRALDL